MSRAKKVQKLVVGSWVANADGIPHFEPCAKQPETDITDVNKMVAWAKENFSSEPGTYSFIRQVPGALILAVQQELKLTFE